MRAFKNNGVKKIKEYRELTGKFDLIDILETVIDSLAADFGVSRLAAKIRMVEAGYEKRLEHLTGMMIITCYTPI
jgi:hypothetical protein